MKSVKVLTFATGVLLVAGLFGCEPTPDDLKLYDQFVVSTNYDKNANFNSFATFALRADTIGLVSNVYGDDTIIVGTNYARPVITQVKDNLISKGFQPAGDTEDPDLAINIYVVKNLNVFQQVNYYPGYYPYYPGYYNYGGYYGYPYVSTYAYNTGVLVVEIVDLVNVNQQNQVKVIWNAFMGDVYSSLDLRQQSLDAINQAFVQSPYLTKQ